MLRAFHLTALVDRGRHRAITIAMIVAAILQLAWIARRGDDLSTTAVYLVLMVAFALLIGITLAFPAGWERFHNRISASARALGGVSWLLWSILLIGLQLLSLRSTTLAFEIFALRVLVYWLAALLGSVILVGGLPGRSFGARLALTVVVATSLYLLARFLPNLSTYPLALSWSETSRYYYASLFTSIRVYGIKASPSVLHPGRYLLQALPFLLPNAGLWLHRLWQVFLWLGLTLACTTLLVRRLKLDERFTRLLVVLWGFLFIFQGPVLYHLLVSVILILWLFSIRHPWRSLGVVILASIWAGISRINWIPVPGLLAATIYFLEERARNRQLLRYLAWPIVWVAIGSMTAMLANMGYVLWSGNEPEQFGSSFVSDLLWYRLLPNHTFLLGILPATALVSASAFIAVYRHMKGRWHQVRSVRWLAVAAIVVTLMVGGILVSVKIGGGSNLHNLDAYLIVLLIVGTYAYFARIVLGGEGIARINGSTWGLQALAVAVPALFALSVPVNNVPLNFELGQRVLREVGDQVKSAGGPEARVLFISERHLITFGMIDDVMLIPGYEKVFLMEMAMSGTRSYLEEFHSELQNQQFDLIVSDPLQIQFQGRFRAFGEENDAWVREVSYPVLCHYEPVLTIPEAEIQILKPRHGDRECPELPIGVAGE